MRRRAKDNGWNQLKRREEKTQAEIKTFKTISMNVDVLIWNVNRISFDLQR